MCSLGSKEMPTILDEQFDQDEDLRLVAPKKKPVKIKITHADIVKAVKDILKTFNIFHWKYFGGPLGQPGVSDFLGIKKVKVSDLVNAGIEEVGIFVAIEVKAGDDTLSVDQENFGLNVQDSAAIFIEARKVDDIVEPLGLKDRVRF